MARVGSNNKAVQRISWNFDSFGGYQFYTTSPDVNWAYYNNIDTDFCPGGSMIYAPTPQFPRYPLAYQVSFTKEELDSIKIYAYPTYTLVEDPPKKQTATGDVDECPSSVMPALVSGAGGLNYIMNGTPAFKAMNHWQINGIPEPVSYYSIPVQQTITDEQGNKQVVFTGHYKSDFSVMNSWQQPGGHIYSYGLYSPAYYPSTVDVGYDTAPQKIQRKMKGQMPDGDWGERACITLAGTPEFGYRWYIILHTANDDFLCWPYLPDNELDFTIVANAPAKWKAQSYKSNVPPQYANNVRPPYPDWVYSTRKLRRDHSEPFMPEPEPRITFNFNSDGTKAIAAMVERTSIAAVGESKFRKINFMNPQSGNANPISSWYFNYVWLAEHEIYAPKDVATGISVEIDAAKRLHGETKPPGPLLYQYDRLGIIELEFAIEVTGKELGDFNFNIAIGRDESPDVLDTYDVGALIDVGYAKPMLNSPLVNNVSVPFVNRDAEVTNKPLANNLLTAFLTLYQHENQKKLDLGSYGCSNTTPTKSKVSFYKNNDYWTATNAILELPLSQRHGLGYSGNAIRDPITDEIIGLPGKPHDFVDYKTNNLGEEHRPHTDTRPPRYIYDAKISYLDITTLSFYYTVRVKKLTTDTEEYTLETIPEDTVLGTESAFHKEFNEVAEMHNTYVFGRIAHQSFCGNKDFKGYLLGWADKSVKDFLQKGEEKIPTAYKNTDIDLYYSETPGNAAPNIWWLNGACGFCIYRTILSSVFGGGYNHDIVVKPNPFPYKNIGANFDDPENTLPGEVITEEEAKDFLRYAVTGWGEFVAGNILMPLFVSYDFETEIITSRGATFFDGEDRCYGNKNPFNLAKEDFDLEKFVAQSAWLMMKLCNLITEITSGRIGIDIYPKYDVNIFKKAVYLLTRPDDENFRNPDIYNLNSKLDVIRDFNYIKKYDWAVHLYNHYRTRRFIADELTDEYGAILTTPEGHYSFYYKDHYAISKKYTSQSACFVKKLVSTDVQYLSDPVGGRAVETRVGNDESLSVLDFDWKQVDGVGWYYGLIKTTHLDLYNMAFTDNWRKAKREDKRNPPYALRTEFPIAGKYSNSNFKPMFVNFLSSSPIRGEPLYRQNKAGDDFYYSLQLETSFPENAVLVSPWNYPGYFYYDSRQYKRHLRLSPLFF